VRSITDGKVYEYNGKRSEDDFDAFLSGGYSSAKSAEAPSDAQIAAGSGGHSNSLTDFVDTVKEAWTEHRVLFISHGLVGLLCLFIGFLVGLIFAACTGTAPAPRQQQRRPVAAAAAVPPAAAAPEAEPTPDDKKNQ